MSTQSRITSLLTLIGSSIIAAVAITAFMVYQYGPTGRYSAKSALLDPALIPIMTFNDVSSITGGQSRFVFDKISFKYYDASEQRTKAVSISVDQYQQFYSLVKSEISMQPISAEIEKLFEKANPPELLIFIRTESNAEWQKETKIFQDVQFANEGNFYRIHLREDKDPQTTSWAYYQSPNIKNEVFKLFLPKQ